MFTEYYRGVLQYNLSYLLPLTLTNLFLFRISALGCKYNYVGKALNMDNIKMDLKLIGWRYGVD
jgi:hypothetical protein